MAEKTTLTKPLFQSCSFYPFIIYSSRLQKSISMEPSMCMVLCKDWKCSETVYPREMAAGMAVLLGRLLERKYWIEIDFWSVQVSLPCFGWQKQLLMKASPPPAWHHAAQTQPLLPHSFPEALGQIERRIQAKSYKEIWCFLEKGLELWGHLMGVGGWVGSTHNLGTTQTRETKLLQKHF